MITDGFGIGFDLICRFCKEPEDKHLDRKCLFDATEFIPMSPQEWLDWRDSVNSKIKLTGADYIRAQLQQASFARRMLSPLEMGEDEEP